MKKYAVAFPGQGSQYIGMGKKIYRHNKIARDIFHEASEVLHYDLCKLCFEGEIETISEMDMVQPVILTASVAAFQVFIRAADERPAFLLGHSLGEISALVCAGAIKFRDAVKLAEKRGRLMGSPLIDAGYMIAVMGLELESVAEKCSQISQSGHIVEISNINSEEQIVISGNTEAVNEAVKELNRMGGRTMEVNTKNPFHCSLMNSVKKELLEELKKYPYSPLEIPVISNVDALPYRKDRSIPDYLSEQLVSAVHWKESVSYVREQGICHIIEMRPQAIIRNLLMTNELGIEAYALDDERDTDYIKSITQSITNGRNNTRENKNGLIQSCITAIAAAKNHNRDKEAGSPAAAGLYNEILQLQKELLEDGTEASYEDMKRSLDLLIKAMGEKNMPVIEQRRWIRDILYQTGLFDLFEDYLEEEMKESDERYYGDEYRLCT